MNIINQKTFLKSIFFLLLIIFFFTLNTKSAKNSPPLVQIWGTAVMIYPPGVCTATYGFPINYQLEPIPYIVAETIDARARASAWFGGLWTVGQQIKANSALMVPCFFFCGPYICTNGVVGWVPILQGTSMPGSTVSKVKNEIKLESAVGL